MSLLPVPRSVTMKEGRFRLTPSFTIAIKRDAGPRLYNAASRVLRRLSGRTGLFFPQDYVTGEIFPDTASCVVTAGRKGDVVLGEDESYTLLVTPKVVLLESKTDLGAIHGLETMLQLLNVDDEGYYLPAIVIQDAPRFPWRGLMMDVARHFMPIDVIKRNLDAMAAVKMNVFHWHLSEDQGFRIESKVFPELNKLGSDGMFYTQDQVRDILAYAEERGIRVYPEFDIPGHSTSWFVSHPELASAPGPYTIERHWGVFDPTFDPTKEATYEFFDKFLAEMTALFPDPYFHIGGDENNGKQWKANPAIQAYMKQHNIPDGHALQAMFNKRILAMLTKYDKHMIGWDEILHPDLPKESIIHSWRGQKGLFDAARKGYQTILSNGYYIDLIQPAEFHYLNDPLPVDSLKVLSENEQKRILGGEATSWAELVTWENVDSRIWPRTSAIAERLWSSAEVRDVEDMYRRIADESFRLEELGLTHRKNHDMMVRRLVNNGSVTALKTLLQYIEPVKIYARHSQGVSYTSSSPYTRVVDAALPEAMAARHFRIIVKEYLSTKETTLADEIAGICNTWKQNHSLLLPTIRKSPVLKEIEPLSSNLEVLGSVATDALEHLRGGASLSAETALRYRVAVELAKKPYGQTQLMMVDAVADLLTAAAAPKK
ncbi:MAG: family 20 glycosylhydrolase [Ignavibacteriales bacterium]|nr:family 20 glycosylhydrolase [Ignavibacteriales bacterium]